MANEFPVEHTQINATSEQSEPNPSLVPYQTTVAIDDVKKIKKLSSSKSANSREKDPLLGKKLDTYWVRAVLGQGGMGRVYLAWHERLERLCALKIVLPELVETEPNRLQMFFAEARSSARLHHPNVVSIHTVGHDRGLHFLEMEFVHGPSLKECLKKAGRLPPAEATRFVAQIASALSAAHRHGVVHCDVKPDNVMVTPDRRAKLADFGLARAYSERTHRGVVGTPAFIAPEVFCEKPATFASDVYALGATWYLLLTGQPPFIAYNLQEMRDHHLFSATPQVTELLPEIPNEICDLIRSMMAKAPDHRPVCSPSLVDHLYSLANSLVPLQKLVAEGMQGLDVQWRCDHGVFTFDVALEGGRRQVMFGEVIDSEGTEGKLFSIWTPCAPALASNFEYVLKMNSRLPFGNVSIRNYKDKPCFVMVENHSRGTVSPIDIRTSIKHLSVWADRIEHALTGGDEH